MARRARVEISRKGGGLSSLEPIDTKPFRLAASPAFAWLTIILVWLFSLLSWRTWQPAPDLLLLVLAYSCPNEPGRVGMITAFVFGMLMDVHDGSLLCVHPLAYRLAASGPPRLPRRRLRLHAVA